MTLLRLAALLLIAGFAMSGCGYHPPTGDASGPIHGDNGGGGGGGSM